MKRYLHILKMCLNLIIFLLALSFENASSERTARMVLLFTGLVTWGLIRPYIRAGQPWWYGVDVILIYLLEYQSKYLVNYFFHILYVSTVLEAGINLNRYKANVVAVAASAAALSKFIAAMKFGINAALISQLLFNIFALAFLITLLNYGKLQQEERRKSQLLYRELVEAYRRLEELSREKEKAAVLEERNRIARDMHDALGHRLTSLIMQLEMGKQALKKNPEEVGEVLERCARGAREALADTRKVVKALKGKESIDIEHIRKMLDEFKGDTGIEIKANLPPLKLSLEEVTALYRVIQEAVTNAVRHGKATRISVDVNEEGKKLKLYVRDNGTGGEYKEGFGISGMRKRFEELGGTLRINAGNGFEVIGEFERSVDR